MLELSFEDHSNFINSSMKYKSYYFNQTKVASTALCTFSQVIIGPVFYPCAIRGLPTNVYRHNEKISGTNSRKEYSDTHPACEFSRHNFLWERDDCSQMVEHFNPPTRHMALNQLRRVGKRVRFQSYKQTNVVCFIIYACNDLEKKLYLIYSSRTLNVGSQIIFFFILVFSKLPKINGYILPKSNIFIF